MPYSDAQRAARKRWDERHPERRRERARRARMYRRWMRAFTRMGVTYEDLGARPDTSIQPHLRSRAVEMMEAYEDILAQQGHKCIVCGTVADLKTPVRDVAQRLLAFACEECGVYVEDHEWAPCE